MKFYQFLKIWKYFNKEKEKTLMQQSMRKEKQRKVGLCFITGRCKKYQKGEVGKSKQLGMTNYNINFKNNFIPLIMNITQTNFLY